MSLVGKIQGENKMENNVKQTPYEIGKTYLIRTVTHYQVGKLEDIYESELVLSNSSWVQDTGRFSDCLKDGLENCPEACVEPIIGNCIVTRGSIVDVCEYHHPLPKEKI